MSLSPALRAATFGVALAVLTMLAGHARAADSVVTCCIERVSTGEPLVPGKALRSVPPTPAPAPALNLTLKITVEVEVRRMFHSRPAQPAGAEHPGRAEGR